MEKLGKELGESLQGGDCVLLSGGLGAGKTTFCRGIAQGLGFSENVTSPTFVRLNIFQGTPNLYHMDFYQAENVEELENFGIYELMEDPNGVALVEWWEKFAEVCPKQSWKVTIHPLSNGRRLEIVDPKGMPWPRK